MLTMTISIEEVANLKVRPVPKPFTLKLYNSRMKENQWEKRWPRQGIVDVSLEKEN